jgi:D-amino-acid dehydrogenase
VVGAAAAYELAADGRQVLLVDRADAGRASDVGAGIISPETIVGRPDPVMALVAAAGPHLDDLVARLAAEGAPDPSFARCGSLVVATQPGEDEWFAAEREAAVAAHPGVMHEIDPAEARARFPALGEVRAALANPNAARVDGRALAESLRTAAVGHGAALVHGSCTAIEVEADRVCGVRVDGTPTPCGSVVVAGGAWTDELAAGFGLAPAVSPLRGQIVHLRLESTDTSSWPIVEPVLGFYAVPWPGGRVAVGGTMDDVGFDVRSTADGLHQLLREGLRLAPGLADATVVETRVGLRPMGADGLPTVGTVPGVDGLVVATGLGTNGLLLGPLSGRLAADLVSSQLPAVDVAGVAVDRWLRPGSAPE